MVRRGRVLVLAALGAGLAAGAAGCAASDTNLTIEVSRQPGRPPERYTLTCAPPGGSLPDAAGACGRLQSADAPFAPLPDNVACTMIFGGLETATVTGVHRGRTVDARFHLRNGCEIPRYQRLMQLLGLP